MRGDKNRRNKQEEETPGYPHYPAREDITNPDNNNGKLNLNEENITLPDVNDIPGQENIHPAPGGMMADTTASSDDEEGIVDGEDILDKRPDDDDDVKIVMGTEADVTAEDLQLLGDKDADMDMGDDESMANFEGLDDTDAEGEPLNERGGTMASTGEDLDVPEQEGGKRGDAMGQDDEENDYYSLGSDDNDNVTEGTP